MILVGVDSLAICHHRGKGMVVKLFHFGEKGLMRAARERLPSCATATKVLIW
jgi:hypothetical protein